MSLERNLYETAVHEAGHIVLYNHFGFNFTGVYLAQGVDAVVGFSNLNEQVDTLVKSKPWQYMVASNGGKIAEFLVLSRIPHGWRLLNDEELIQKCLDSIISSKSLGKTGSGCSASLEEAQYALEKVAPRNEERARYFISVEAEQCCAEILTDQMEEVKRIAKVIKSDGLNGSIIFPNLDRYDAGNYISAKKLEL